MRIVQANAKDISTEKMKLPLKFSNMSPLTGRRYLLLRNGVATVNNPAPLQICGAFSARLDASAPGINQSFLEIIEE